MTVETRDDQRGKKWHFDKSVNYQDLVTTVAIVVSIFWWAAKVDTRVTVIETQAAMTVAISKESEIRNAIMLRDNFNELKASQIRIEVKLDSKQDKVRR